MIDTKASNPPPELPAPATTLLVQITGSGTVTSSGQQRYGADRGPANIRCGIEGLQCYDKVDSNTQVTLSAKPAAGNTFVGWSGACSGAKAVCSEVSAASARSVTAVFAPKQRRAAVRYKVVTPTIRANWARSVGKGTLIIRGSVSAAARLHVVLYRPGGGPLFGRDFNVPPGAFQVQRTLKKGVLAGGATLLPGGFVVSIRARAGRIPLPFQVRTLTLSSPSEGVVRKAFSSSSQNGAPQKKLAVGVKQAWATFRFETQPTRGPIVASWYAPSGQLIGKVARNNRPTIKTGIGSNIGLGAGTFRVDLAAGGKIVHRLSVRVG